jgi:protein SCO1
MKMKKIYLIIFPVVIVLGLGLVTINYTGSNTAEATVKGEKIEEKESCCPTEHDAGEFTDNSLYQLENRWIDQSGNDFSLADLKGKPVVLTMFFASCTYACPILVYDMKKIENSIPQRQLNDYQFVMVTIDHERDKPEALLEFAKRYQLDLNRWKLLYGDKDDIMDLAALIGFKYKKEKDGDYSHSNIITVLNDEGEIIHQHVGLNQDMTAAVTIVKSI